MRSRSVVVVDVGVENVADERRVLSDGGNHRARLALAVGSALATSSTLDALKRNDPVHTHFPQE